MADVKTTHLFSISLKVNEIQNSARRLLAIAALLWSKAAASKGRSSRGQC